MSKNGLIALVLAKAAQVEALIQRVAKLEVNLWQPPKTPDNPARALARRQAEPACAKQQAQEPIPKF